MLVATAECDRHDADLVHLVSGCDSPAIRRRFIVATILYLFCVTTFGNMIGAAIPSQVAAMQAVALTGFLLVYMLSGLLFPDPEYSGRDSLDFQFRLGPLLHRSRAGRAPGGRRLAVGVDKVLAIGAIGSVFYTIAWRNMRRMQLKD